MEDRELVTSILKDKKTQAFSHIVKKYEAKVYSRVLSITKQGETAREVTQQTFIRVYQRLADWRGVELGPWITAIACHLSINHLEKEKRHRRTIDASRLEQPSEEYSAEHEERLALIEQAIAKLAPDDRELIRLFYYHKVKTDEIARRTGLTQSNVLVRLHRIRERLKKQIGNERDE